MQHWTVAGLKNVKNTHGAVSLLVKCRLKYATLPKVRLLQRFFSRLLNCTNSTKSRKVPQMIYFLVLINQVCNLATAINIQNKILA